MGNGTLNRRSFLQKAGSAILSASLPTSIAVPLSLNATIPAQAQYIEAAQLGLSVLSFAGVFGKKSNGDALRLAAIDAKLNVTLDNQVRILEGILALNGSIENLSEEIRAQLRDERYLTLLTHARGITDSVNNLAGELDALGNYSKWDQSFYNRYQDLAFEFQDKVSEFKNTLDLTQTGSHGIASVMYASAASYLLADDLKKLGLMELRFPDTRERKGWVPHIFYYNLAKDFSEGITTLSRQRLGEAVAEQKTNAQTAISTARQGPWAPYTDRVLLQEGEVIHDVCFSPEWHSVHPNVYGGFYKVLRNRPARWDAEDPWIHAKTIAQGQLKTATQLIEFPASQVTQMVIAGYERLWMRADWIGRMGDNGDIFDLNKVLAGNVDKSQTLIVKAEETANFLIGCGVIEQVDNPEPGVQTAFNGWANNMLQHTEATRLNAALEHAYLGLIEIEKAHDNNMYKLLIPALEKIDAGKIKPSLKPRP